MQARSLLSSWRSAALLALVALVPVGCGASTGAVSGTVTYKGNPVTSGEVSIIVAEGPSRSAQITPEGTYSMTGVPPGDVTIIVVASKIISETPPKPPSADGTDVKPLPIKMRTVSLVPQKYNEPSTSDLKFTIKGGSQTIDLELKD